MQRSFDRLAAAAGVIPEPVVEPARVPAPKLPEQEVEPVIPVEEVSQQPLRH
jgi:hypothetical protein